MIGDGMGPDNVFPFGIIGATAWLLVAAGAVLLVIWAVRVFPGRARHGAQVQPNPVESPLDTLARRFALGQITADEFERARALLRNEPPG